MHYICTYNYFTHVHISKSVRCLQSPFIHLNYEWHSETLWFESIWGILWIVLLSCEPRKTTMCVDPTNNNESTIPISAQLLLQVSLSAPLVQTKMCPYIMQSCTTSIGRIEGFSIAKQYSICFWQRKVWKMSILQ